MDDSAVIRGLMSQALEAYAEIAIVGRAANGETAINIAKELQPDIIILDIEMPVMDGITALPHIVKISPRSKIIMASTLTSRNASISLQALALGATDYLAKPTAKTGNEVDIFYRDLVSKIYGLSGLPVPSTPASGKPAAPVLAPPPVPRTATPRVTPLQPGGKLNPMGFHALAIASSTGGPQALMQFFGALKGRLNSLPIYITQHMPPTFTTILAEQLGKASGKPAQEGKDGVEVQPGQIYIAPGDYHMVAERQDKRVVIRTNQNAPENFCRPAADPMLRALA
ncbi:MAG: response regulator, partial [Rickettsiales bacterium]|nr:response regulator [Rickettsiales bacterium]